MKGSLRQRSPGSWEITLDLGVGSGGKRQRKYVTVRGNKSQAQRRMRELLSVLDKGMALPAEKISVGDWLDRWMNEQVIPYRRQSTKERYQGVIKLHLKSHIGHIELTRLAPFHVQALESRLSREGMAPSGVSLVHNVLSGAMRYAMRMELIYRNPVALVSPPPHQKREPNPPAIRAVRDALALARADDHHLAACIHLISYTGLRRGEALGLTWDNVYLDEGYVFIRASLVRTRERGLMLEPPKTESGRRRVDLDATTVEVLRRHQKRQDEIKGAMGEAYEDRGAVFAGALGEWINPGQLARAVQSLGKKVGYPGMTVRSLRHFHASVALQSRQNIVVVSKRLGHSNVSITSDIYAHVLPGWQKETAEAFAEAMEEDEL